MNGILDVLRVEGHLPKPIGATAVMNGLMDHTSNLKVESEFAKTAILHMS
jgi:hypothetical protein